RDPQPHCRLAPRAAQQLRALATVREAGRVDRAGPRVPPGLLRGTPTGAISAIDPPPTSMAGSPPERPGFVGSFYRCSTSPYAFATNRLGVRPRGRTARARNHRIALDGLKRGHLIRAELRRLLGFGKRVKLDKSLDPRVFSAPKHRMSTAV